MSFNYHFIVATRLGEDEAQLTPEFFSVNSGSFGDMLSTYYAAVGEEIPYVGWLEDAIGDVHASDAIVEADDCREPDACLETLATLREGMVTHAALLPPFTWITQRRADGQRGYASSSARVQFEGAEWSVSGGFEPTKAHEVVPWVARKGRGKAKKGRIIDLRGADTWDCQDQSGNPLVLEFNRRPFHELVQRDLTGIANIFESARKQGGLVAVLAIQ
jgi:hypothetical protein